MAKVVDQAYYCLHRKRQLIERSFTCTGINVEPTGSQDSLISIKGFENEQDLDISGWMTIPTLKVEEMTTATEPDSEPLALAEAAEPMEPIATIDLTT
jgi:hypothetical protein